MSFSMYAYSDIPTPAPVGMWYAAWSTAAPCVQWSQTPPSTVPDGQTSWVVGVVDSDDAVSSRATPLTGGGKQLPPQPALQADSLSGFQSAFGVWAAATKSFGDL